MNTVLHFWYIDSLPRFWQSFLNTIESFEQTVAIRITLANLLQPIFQDYSTAGRVIGFFLRLFRVAGGFVLYCGVAVAYLVFAAFWLVFPLTCLISLISSLVA